MLQNTNGEIRLGLCQLFQQFGASNSKVNIHSKMMRQVAILLCVVFGKLFRPDLESISAHV